MKALFIILHEMASIFKCMGENSICEYSDESSCLSYCQTSSKPSSPCLKPGTIYMQAPSLLRNNSTVWFMVFILIFILGIVKIKHVLVLLYHHIFLGMELRNGDSYLPPVSRMPISAFSDLAGFGWRRPQSHVTRRLVVQYTGVFYRKTAYIS